MLKVFQEEVQMPKELEERERAEAEKRKEKGKQINSVQNPAACELRCRRIFVSVLMTPVLW